ncbi:TetR/AcrR family transcriptional regulator [Beijerinckia indica]|uniref:Putative transcriptional regulator, TetR family n=1 Tax=Beijerinckia indica subsp. indica (strain ATCC 9039 / DSM 1715 / NCIMB 8712) TaxID=395963 RepID=B2IIG6_BEII9|nr:TetR/AcrR family transcriptional regulator [Beijerinckia indica]ACB96119.1 putative transcriptional regulator, TetR family [Beijerinckia indica subsp. indica ATCC 9039]
MARPVEPELKAALLEKIIAYVWEHGIADFSLRPLAAVIGSSPRNIAYHFGSREDLLCVIFNTIRERMYDDFRVVQQNASSLEDALRKLWAWTAAPENRKLLKLLYEIFGTSVNHPDRFDGYARWVVTERLKFIGSILARFEIKDNEGQELATLIMIIFHGATLDLTATDDVARIERVIHGCIERIKLLTNA